ncbi:MSCRAMM family protein [Streptococcus sp. X13SY08]|uniref:MSCRAMM family protein n=1 Tax=Streptococcus sp. X13SY08 TaxID=1676616 RepID=UPI003FA6D8AC
MSKQNIAGDNLDNATVTVRDKQTGQVVSDVNGVKLENYVTTKENLKVQLAAGEYTFEENTTPAGYDVVTTFTFTVDGTGQVTTTSTEAKTNGSILTVIDQAKKHDIEISKVGLGGEDIAGAQIEIRDTANQVVNKWTSNGAVQTISLLPGVYTFHEIATPTGYVKVTAITFAISKDGQVYILNGDGNKVASDQNTLTVVDEAVAKQVETPTGSFTIQKVDAVTNAVLEGAIFSVTGKVTETNSTVDSSTIDRELTRFNEETATLQAELETLQKAEKVDEALINEVQAELDLVNNKVASLFSSKKQISNQH